jgi:hypothetical protein
MGGQQPSVGRTVHYVSHGTPVRGDGSQAFTAECRAAIVTEVVVPLTGMDAGQAEVECWDEEARYNVGLCVLNPTGQFFNTGLHYDPNNGAGTWHWPERV